MIGAMAYNFLPAQRDQLYLMAVGCNHAIWEPTTVNCLSGTTTSRVAAQMW